MGETITLSELVRLVQTLRSDPSSAIAAAVEGWTNPVDRMSLVLMDLYDLTMAINADPKKGRPAAHPGRPYDMSQDKRRQIGATGGRTRAEVVQILNSFGHNLPV